jgi:hypothetical protein
MAVTLFEVNHFVPHACLDQVVQSTQIFLPIALLLTKPASETSGSDFFHQSQFC